jgi:hypothetical protein
MSTTPRFSTPWLRAFALWAQALSAEGNPLGDVLKNYADKWADDLAAQSQPEAQPVATIIACSEVDLDGNPRMERDIEWHEGDIADLPVGTKLYAGPAAPQSEAQPEPVRSAVKQYDLDQSPDYRKGYEDGRRNGYEVGKRHAAPQSELSDALRTLLDFQNDVEVMGEWEAQEINHKMLKKARARQAEIVTKCRAVLAAQAGKETL